MQGVERTWRARLAALLAMGWAGAAIGQDSGSAMPTGAGNAPIAAVTAPVAQDTSWQAPLVGPKQNHFFFSADWLLWKARRTGADLAIVDPVNDGIPDGFVGSVNYGVDAGFRLGLGILNPACTWDTALVYTHFNTDNGARFTESVAGTLLTPLTHPLGVSQATTAAGSIALRYDTFDVELGRRYMPAQDLSLRLVGGARLAWINNKLDFFYNGRDTTGAVLRMPCEFDGGGLRFGADGKWDLCQRVSLFANAYGSLLGGKFRVRTFESNVDGQFVLTDVEQKFEQFVPAAELMVGVNYQTNHWRLSMGYQVTHYFNMISNLSFADDIHVGKFYRNRSDLTLDGLMLKVGVDF